MAGLCRNANSKARTDDWHLLLHVFSRLDGVSLARASCACKTWSQVGVEGDVWKQICLAKWPSLDSNVGSSVVKQAGGYRQLFARRFHAQHAQPCSNEAKPRLSFQNLIFLVDLMTVENEVVCSFIRRGHELYCGEETFSFRVCLRDGEVTGKGKGVQGMETVKDFKVSWAVMVRGSDRVFQVMDSKKPGQTMGRSCNFSEALADHHCCCPAPGMSQHLAEVGLGFGVGVNEEGRLGLKEVCLRIINTLTWRYFSLSDALRYLQNFFFEFSNP